MTGRTSKPPRPVGDTPLTPEELAYARAHKRAQFKRVPSVRKAVWGARGGTNRKEPAGLALPALPALKPSVWDDIPFKPVPYVQGGIEYDGRAIVRTFGKGDAPPPADVHRVWDGKRWVTVKAKRPGEPRRL